MKKAGVATKDDLKDLATKDDLKKGLGKLERSLKLRMGKHKKELLSGIANVALKSPTLSNFDKLKEKVDRHHTN